MSEIPNTDNVIVAKIAAALELSLTATTFEEALERFKKAYKAVSKAVEEDAEDES